MSGLFYEDAANRLRAAGLTVGCGSRRYCGEEEISGSEMAAMLARALRLPATGSDRFVDDEGSIFENAINKIAERVSRSVAILRPATGIARLQRAPAARWPRSSNEQWSSEEIRAAARQ